MMEFGSGNTACEELSHVGFGMDVYRAAGMALGEKKEVSIAGEGRAEGERMTMGKSVF